MLKIQGLQAEIEGKQILNGISLDVKLGEIHAIMGPNGGGKSTLAQVLAGNPEYKVNGGFADIAGEDLLKMTPDERANAGLFLSFQYPVEVAGVNFLQFLRQAYHEMHRDRLNWHISPIALRKQVAVIAERLGFTEELSKRLLNTGFSGGEKKKLEIIQMAILQPDYVILDEPDSGLDVDALRKIAKEIDIQRSQHPMGLIIITHYQKILDYIKPDFVHVVVKGQIVKKGNWLLAKQIEKEGYEQFK